jgi:hypothetical protein
MKKIIAICIAAISAATMTVKAADISVGLVGGLGIGAQAKFMFTENLGLIEELGYFMNLDGGTAEKYGRSSYAGLVNNTTFVYQRPITRMATFQVDWYAGGQAKIGWMPFNFERNVHMGIFGLGTAGGVEVKIKEAPISLSFDFRPGWAMMFYGDGVGVHMFDYSFNLGVRYRL